MGKMSRIRPKDIKRLTSNGVFDPHENRILSEMLTDSQVQPCCIGSTVDDIIRTKKGSIAMVNRNCHTTIVEFEIGNRSANMYPDNCDAARLAAYRGKFEKYGFDVYEVR